MHQARDVNARSRVLPLKRMQGRDRASIQRLRFWVRLGALLGRQSGHAGE
jgi:hypothetical protein